MNDFEFLQNKLNGKWVVSAPSRSRRTNVEKKTGVCPFCPGQEVAGEEVYRVQNTQKTQQAGDSDSQIVRVSEISGGPSAPTLPAGRQGFPKDSDWSIRVIANNFPFAPHHEVIIHSPDHKKNFDELPSSAVDLIFQTYRQRFNAHKKDGLVYIFNNSGSAAGASLSHPHSQLAVIPHKVKLDIAPLDPVIYSSEDSENSGSQNFGKSDTQTIRSTDLPSTLSVLKTEHFFIFCPTTSEWPDEVWVAPKINGGGFGLIKDQEISDLSFVLSRLIQIFDLRHGSEFPYNFYIAPLKNWYLRLIPRKKTIGGFELGTNIIVNTQDPADTFGFILEHFWTPDHEKITAYHQARYRKGV